MKYFDENFFIKKWVIINLLIVIAFSIIFSLFFKTNWEVNNYLSLYQGLVLTIAIFILVFWRFFFFPHSRKAMVVNIILPSVLYLGYIIYLLILYRDDGEVFLTLYVALRIFVIPITIGILILSYIHKKGLKKLFILGLFIISTVILVINYNEAGGNFIGFIDDVNTPPQKIDRNQCWKILLTLENITDKDRYWYEKCKTETFEDRSKKYSEFQNTMETIKSDLYLGKVSNIDYPGTFFELITSDRAIILKADANIQIFSLKLEKVKFIDIKIGHDLRVYGRQEDNIFKAYRIFDDSI